MKTSDVDEPLPAKSEALLAPIEPTEPLSFGGGVLGDGLGGVESMSSIETPQYSTFDNDLVLGIQLEEFADVQSR
jgi:hypothetical protein